MNKNLYTSLIGQLTKKGKKKKAIEILNNAMLSVSLKTNLSIFKIFKIISKKLGSIIETKTVKLRRNVHIIPFPLNTSRRFYLISKNIISSVNENTSKISIEEKITEEVYSLIKNKHSKSLQKKTNTLKQATKNKANIHYRW